MKYIRMKNKWTDDFEGSEIIREVYQVHSLTKGDDMNLWAFTFEGFPYCITEENILKQADTIEELCDAFVFEETYPSGLKRHIITEDVCVGTQFGAIWTDKGLIYVAKMNDKGELELL